MSDDRQMCQHLLRGEFPRSAALTIATLPDSSATYELDESFVLCPLCAGYYFGALSRWPFRGTPKTEDR
jgi:hypothetical protein